MEKFEFELAGVNAGKTINLGGYQFVDGVFTHETENKTGIEGLATYLERSYFAFPKGSQQLRDAQATYEAEQAGNPVKASQPSAREKEQPQPAIKEAVETLDHTNDAHWTGAGLPAIEAVSDLAGTKVSREMVEAAAPGYNRAAAKAASTL